MGSWMVRFFSASETWGSLLTCIFLSWFYLTYIHSVHTNECVHVKLPFTWLHWSALEVERPECWAGEHEGPLCLSSRGRCTEKERQAVIVIFSRRQFWSLFSWWERQAIYFIWGFDLVPTSKLQRNAVFSFPLLFIVVSSCISLSVF